MASEAMDDIEKLALVNRSLLRFWEEGGGVNLMEDKPPGDPPCTPLFPWTGG
jgi:hypothetical protein